MSETARVDPLRETAAAWHERLSRDKAPGEVNDEFQRWLAASPTHRSAYEAVDRTWSTLRSASLDARILALRHETALRLTRKTSASIRPLRWAAAALVAVGVGFALAELPSSMDAGSGALPWLRATLGLSHEARYATTTGERLNVALEDGSEVTLNTQSEMVVAYTKMARTVRLLRGQALFEVAKNRARPFVVEAHNRRFVAVGTAFDVQIDGEQIEVTMLAGTVRAQGSGGEAPDTTLISAGEELTAVSHGPDQVRRADPERVTSWRRGQVVFENTRLGDAVREINRYSNVHIELAEPELADLRLSGAFATGASDVFVEAITAYYPIVAEHQGERRVILRTH